MKKIIKENYILLIFIITNLINSALLIKMTTHINNFRFIIGDLLVLLFISGFSFIVKKRKLYFFFWSLVLSLVCCINSLYFNQYNDFISFSLLNALFQALKLPKAAITDVFEFVDFIFILQPIFMLIVLKFDKTKQNINKQNFKQFLLASFILLVIMIMNLSSNDIYRFKNEWNKVYVANNFGIYVYQIKDITYFLKRNLFPSLGKENAIKNISKYKYENTIVNEYTDIFKDKNMILIHAESVQSLFVEASIGGKEIMPNLSKIAKEGLYFTNYYSQESTGTSSDTEFTINNSLLPVGVGTVFLDYYDNNYLSMPTILKEKGYYTFSMHGNICEFWNRNKMYEKIGYEHFYCYDEYDLTDKIGIGLSDKSFLNQSVDIIKQINTKYDKYYGTLITLTNHTPFYNEGKVSFDVSYMEGTNMGDYIKLLHYFDEAIGDFINKMAENNLLEDTVIVIYGDHDAKFKTKDYDRYLNYDIKNDQMLDESNENYIEIDFYKYEDLTKVPLIIWTKDKKVSGRVDTLMGAYDVLPTLGNMFGFKSKYQLGHDIFNVEDNIVVFPDGNWRTDKVYYNNQKNEYKLLTNENISENYIKEKEAFAKKVLEISNSLIKYNLFD